MPLLFYLRKLRMKWLVKLIIIIILAQQSIACSTAPISLHARSAAKLNLDQQQKSLPVLVRIYELSDMQNFMRANFYELWQKPKEILADSLVFTKTFVVSPKSSRKLTIPRIKTAKYVGVIAIFRHPNTQHYKITKSLSKYFTFLSEHISIYLQNNTIVLLS